MGSHYQCMNCGNTTEGDKIYKCDRCGKIYCSSCIKSCYMEADECPRCESKSKTKIGVISSSRESRSSDSQCYITTATLIATQQTDGGQILSTFRYFRDNWLMKQPNGESLVKDYYRVAPKIVINIDKRENAKSIYQNIYDDYLFECYQLIKESKFNEAFEKYKLAVLDLKTKYFK